MNALPVELEHGCAWGLSPSECAACVVAGRRPLAGHALRFQGAPYTEEREEVWHVRGDGQRTRYGGEGRGLCECGALSPLLTSDAKRKAWHRDHKALQLRGTS